MKLTDDIKITLVTAFCLILIAVLFQTVIDKPLDLLALLGPFYVLFLYMITRNQIPKGEKSRPRIWNIIIILITFLIILVYALK
jgi:hypothetical protein